jgi:uncharacterized protein (DUF2141 family)
LVLAPEIAGKANDLTTVITGAGKQAKIQKKIFKSQKMWPG